MDALFRDALRKVLSVEGGYSNHPDDPGGKTRFGISEALARHAGYSGPMTELPHSTARRIYYDHFWQPLKLSEVAAQAGPILAREMFESAVNVGPTKVATWLQEWLNVLNRQASDYEDIAEDGKMGPATLESLRAYLDRRGLEGAAVLRAGLNSDQAIHYKSIARSRPRFESFTYGWMLRRIVPSHS